MHEDGRDERHDPVGALEHAHVLERGVAQPALDAAEETSGLVTVHESVHLRDGGDRAAVLLGTLDEVAAGDRELDLADLLGPEIDDASGVLAQVQVDRFLPDARREVSADVEGGRHDTDHIDELASVEVHGGRIGGAEVDSQARHRHHVYAKPRPAGSLEMPVATD